MKWGWGVIWQFPMVVFHWRGAWGLWVAGVRYAGASAAAEHGRGGRASAFASVFGQRGASPLRAGVLRPVTNCHCVAARRGGEQQEVNDWSVTRALQETSR